MVPNPPTATTVLASSLTTASKPFPCGSGFCQNQPDWANDLVGTLVTPDRNKRPRKTFMIAPTGWPSSPYRGYRWKAQFRRSWLRSPGSRRPPSNGVGVASKGVELRDFACAGTPYTGCAQSVTSLMCVLPPHHPGDESRVSIHHPQSRAVAWTITSGFREASRPFRAVVVNVDYAYIQAYQQSAVQRIRSLGD